MRLFLIALLFNFVFAYNIAPPNYSAKIKILKQLRLDYFFNNLEFSEISDIAYNKHSSMLYMVSDEGALFKFVAKFSKDNIKLTPVAGYRLKSKKGKIFRGSKADSEGLAIDNRGNLFISFEGRPRVAKFSTTGLRLKKIKLPKLLKSAKLRSKNKSLEALAWHKKYGLLTALEYPPKGEKKENQRIYLLNGKSWRVKLEPVNNNAITAIEVMDDGNLLVLERAYNGIFGKFEINLVKLYINGCKFNTFCKKEKLLTIDSAKGWQVQNFEGLAKVGKNRYLLISDDNQNPFLNTTLIYFKVIY